MVLGSMSVFPVGLQMQAFLPTAPAPAPTGSSFSSLLYTVVGIVIVGALLYGVYWYATNKASGAWNPIEAIARSSTTFNGKEMNSISGASIPPGVQDYGVQFWMYIKDWDYKYGQSKVVLRRTDPSASGVYGPEISLAPNENTLEVKVALFPNDPNASQRSEPAPSNQGGSATGDGFTCKVENVPLQSWFAVSVTVFQRNLDIYLNGKLVKSCVLPGVPRPVAGDIQVGPEGGFSGTVCDVYSYAKGLVPSDALAFYTQGTPCSGTDQTPEKGLTGNLFGYTAKFGLFDKSGKVVKEYAY